MSLYENIQAHLRDTAHDFAKAISVPPFVAFLHAKSTNRAVNCAIPDRSVCTELSESVIDELRTIFKAHDRELCFRFLSECAPHLDCLLQKARFIEAPAKPLVICTAETYKPVGDVKGLSLLALSSKSALEDLRQSWEVNAEGFGTGAPPASDAQIENLRGSLQTARAFVARLNGQPAAAGMYTEIRHGTTELVGVTTLKPFRRQGIAAVLTAYAVQLAFDSSASAVFTSPANDQARRIYDRVGFHLNTNLRCFWSPNN